MAISLWNIYIKELSLWNHNVYDVTLWDELIRPVIRTVTWNRYVDLTDNIRTWIVSLKAFWWQRQVSRNYIDSCVVEWKNELRNVPNWYVELEYIESTWTQYIDTWITPTKANQTKALVTFQIHWNLNTQMALWANSNLNHYGWWTNFRFCGKEITAKDNLKHTVILQNTSTERKFTFGWTEYSANAASLEYPFWLFWLWWTNYYSPYRVYECKMRENDVLVRDMIPCINTEWVIWMYDLVNDMFYWNQGSGEFIAWSVIDIPWYEMLEYIESTWTQYINTWYVPQNLDEIWLDFEISNYTSDANNKFIIGQQESSFWTWLTAYGSVFYFRYWNDTSASIPTEQYQTWRHIWNMSRNWTSSILKIDWTEVVRNWNYWALTQTPISLFTRLSSSWSAWRWLPIKLYNVNIKNNGALVRMYIPARKNWVIWMYDIIWHQFLTNAWTWVFVAWDVLNSNPTPTSPKRLWNNNWYYTANGVSWVSTLTDSEWNVVQLPNLNDWDIVDVISWTTTQKYIVEILTWTETNWYCSWWAMYYSNSQASWFPKDNYPNIYSTHFIKWYASIIAENDDLTIFLNSSSSSSTTNWNRSMKYTEVFTSVDAWKARLAEQYANWTPVINLLPIVTPISWTITAQVLDKSPIAYNWNVELDEPTVVETLHTEPTVKFPLDLEINNWNFKPINYVRTVEWTNPEVENKVIMSNTWAIGNVSWEYRRSSSDYISVTPWNYKLYISTSWVSSASNWIAFYNWTTYISWISWSTLTENGFTFEVPSSADKCRLCTLAFNSSTWAIYTPIENLWMFRVEWENNITVVDDSIEREPYTYIKARDDWDGTWWEKITTTSAFTSTDYIRIKPWEYRVYQSWLTSASAAWLCIYDKDKNCILWFTTNGQVTRKTFTVPENWYYIRCSITNTATYSIYEDDWVDAYHSISKPYKPWLYNTETIQNSISWDKVYAEPLLQDWVHNITTWEVNNTRWYYIFDWSEDIRIQALSIPNQVWVYWYNWYRTIWWKVLPLADMQTWTFMYSNYLKNWVAWTSSAAVPNSICPNWTWSNILMNMDSSIWTTADKVKQWLQQKLVEWNPLVVIYQLATPNTYTVETQDMTIPQWNSRIEIIEWQILDLWLEAKYFSYK